MMMRSCAAKPPAEADSRFFGALSHKGCLHHANEKTLENTIYKNGLMKDTNRPHFKDDREAATKGYGAYLVVF